MREPNRPEERRRSRAVRTAPAIIKSEIGVDKPKNTQGRAKKPTSDPVEDLAAMLSRRVVGQPAATKVIVPYIQMFQAGLEHLNVRRSEEHTPELQSPMYLVCRLLLDKKE